MTKKAAAIILLNLSFICAASAQTLMFKYQDKPNDSNTVTAPAQPATAFSYQGKLTDAGAPANGQYDLIINFYDATPSLLGSANGNVQVTAGIFTISVDGAGPLFAADTPKFLEIAVRPTGSVGAYTTLTPRQPITASPYSLRTSSAVSSDGLSAVCVGCVTNAHIQSLDGSKLTGTISGNGSGITNINGGNIAGGTVSANQLSQDLIDGPQRSLGLVASRRWDLLRPQSNFAVGFSPAAVEFDGANIWVANQNGGSVSKLRASDGANQGTFTVAGSPTGLAFDGVNMWVTGFSGNIITKVRASDGANLGTFPVGANPGRAAFDGANIWVANNGGGTVTKLRASDGALQGTFTVGSGPYAIAFDGVNIWVSNNNVNTVTRLRASDGACVATCTFTVGANPYGVVFDGANIWVASSNGNNVMKLRASDGAVQGTFSVTFPSAVAFDGTNIWVTSLTANNVTKLRASDGVNLGTFAVGAFPQGAAFDGTNIWVTNSNGGTVTRLFPAFPQ
jgi:hypothetical protein